MLSDARAFWNAVSEPGAARCQSVRESGPLALAVLSRGFVLREPRVRLWASPRREEFSRCACRCSATRRRFDRPSAGSAVGRATWHARRRTTLVEPVIDSCKRYAGAGERFSLVAYMLGGRDRAEIASLARIVSAHADAGDRIARSVLHEAADAISETARDALDVLGGPWPGCALVAAARCTEASLWSGCRTFTPLWGWFRYTDARRCGLYCCPPISRCDRPRTIDLGFHTRRKMMQPHTDCSSSVARPFGADPGRRCLFGRRPRNHGAPLPRSGLLLGDRSRYSGRLPEPGWWARGAPALDLQPLDP